MNRAALAGALAVMAGALFWSRRAQAAPSQSPVVAEWWSPASLFDSAASVLSDVVNAVKPGPWQPPASAAPYLPTIYSAEDEHGIPRNLLARLLWQESRYRADIISGATRSPVGAVGIAQFMPATAAELGVDPLNPEAAIRGAARYLRQLYNATGDWRMALAAYNWGIGNLQRKGFAQAPRETRDYVDSIAGAVLV